MAVVLDVAAGLAAGVATGFVTHFAGDTITKTVIGNEEDQCARLLARTSLCVIVDRFLTYTPFSIGMKIGMTATSGLLTAKNASQISQRQMAMAFPGELSTADRTGKLAMECGIAMSFVGTLSWLPCSVVKERTILPYCFTHFMTHYFTSTTARRLLEALNNER